MKELYELAECEVVEFDTEDVITTSGAKLEEGETPLVPIVTTAKKQ